MPVRHQNPNTFIYTYTQPSSRFPKYPEELAIAYAKHFFIKKLENTGRHTEADKSLWDGRLLSHTVTVRNEYKATVRFTKK